jgi:SsrA-binding protein
MAPFKKQIASNKKAFHNYEISEKLECGISLSGYEVKSLRQGNITLSDAYVKIYNDELWLIGCYIPEYKQAHNIGTINTRRDRKLLIHKSQLRKLRKQVDEKGLLLIPTKMYFLKQNVKVEIGVGSPKKLFDKRDTLKKRTQQREIDRNTKI